MTARTTALMADRAPRLSTPAGRWLRRSIPYAVLVGYCAVVLVPLVWVVLASVKTRREVFLSPLGLPETIRWDNYANAFEGGFHHYVLNSLIITVGAVVPMVAVSILAAYALARRVFVGRTLIYLAIVLTYAVPFHSILVPLYRMVDSMGLLNTYAGLILPNVALGIPFSVVILYAFFLDFPDELEEAARLDGCKPWRVLWSVVLPLSMPAILSVVIFQTVHVWNEFLWATISTSDDAMRPWTSGIMQFQGEYSSDWPKILAVVNLMTLPLLIVYMAAQRHFVRAFAGMGK